MMKVSRDSYIPGQHGAVHQPRKELITVICCHSFVLHLEVLLLDRGYDGHLRKGGKVTIHGTQCPGKKERQICNLQVAIWVTVK